MRKSGPLMSFTHGTPRGPRRGPLLAQGGERRADRAGAEVVAGQAAGQAVHLPAQPLDLRLPQRRRAPAGPHPVPDATRSRPARDSPRISRQPTGGWHMVAQFSGSGMNITSGSEWTLMAVYRDAILNFLEMGCFKREAAGCSSCTLKRRTSIMMR